MMPEESEIGTFKSERLLKVMRLLSRELTRSIIKSLLEGPKDLRTICREVYRRKTTVYDAIKELVDAQIVNERFVKTGGVGRTKKEYSISEISVPSIPQDVMLDFLEGKDITAKSLDRADIGIALDTLAGRIPVPPFVIFTEMLQSRIEPKYAIHILIDLGSSADSVDTFQDYEAFIEFVIKLMKSRYPIEEESIEIFTDLASRTIIVSFQEGEAILKVEDLVEIMRREFRLSSYESDFLASRILYTIKILGLRSVEYEFLVVLTYLNAKQLGMECRKPDCCVEFSKTKLLGSSPEIFVLESGMLHPWKTAQISDFFQKKFKIEREEALFLTKDLLENLRYLRFDRYSISFIEALGREIMRERGL
jgi:predicted transcriptional regulator